MPETLHDPNAKVGQRGHMSAYVSPFGKREGLAERLTDAMKRMGSDKSLPWVGLGLIDDLRCAVGVLTGTEPPMPVATGRGELFAQLAAERPRPTNDLAPVNSDVEDWERALPAASAEFDL